VPEHHALHGLHHEHSGTSASTATEITQIALTDLLKSMGIQPNGIIGHSTGEMACAYADGGLTLEQTMKLAYWRGTPLIYMFYFRGKRRV